MKLLQSVAALLLSITIASTMYAQEIPIPDYTIYNNGQMGSLLTQIAIDKQQGKSSTPKKTGAATTSNATLAYTSTPALKQQTVNGYIQRLKTANPAASKAVADNFGSGKYDYATIYNGLIDGYGLQQNNAADAVTAYMVLGYMIVHNIQDDKAMTPTMVQALRTDIAPILAQNTALAKAGVAAQLGEEMKLQLVMIHAGWQAAGKENTLPAYRQGVNNIFKNQWGMDLSKLTLTNDGLTAVGTTTTAANNSNATQSKTTGNTNNQPVVNGTAPAVEGWFFRAISGYPAAISFEPIVLFKNGEYYEVSEQPLESLNVAQAKQSKPTAWGTWQKKRSTYWLTNSKNKSIDYTLGSGSWFPAYPYPSGIGLKKGYEKVSGGDVGNGTTSLSVEKLYFVDATHFTQGTDAGIVSPNAAGGSKSSAAGTYKIHGNTLELMYNDGKTVKTSFAFGAKGTPAQPTNTMIFIGGEPYTDID